MYPELPGAPNDRFQWQSVSPCFWNACTVVDEGVSNVEGAEMDRIGTLLPELSPFQPFNLVFWVCAPYPRTKWEDDRMLVESSAIQGFQVLRIQEDLSVNSDISEIKTIIKDYLQKGITRIALGFSQDSYLYTRSIAVLVQCLEMIDERKGVMAIFRPNEDILDMLGAINLDSRVLIAYTEHDLAARATPHS